MIKRECITSECLGCDKIISIIWTPTRALVRVCLTYSYPRIFRYKGCPLHSVKGRSAEKKEKVRIGQQKQSKIKE